MSKETKIEVEDVASYIKYINGLSPTINDLDRQAAQSGQYILFPNDIRGKDPCLSFDDLISPLPKDSPVIAGRCIVPSDRKVSILNELSKLGITEASLFPDSIEKRCAGIVSEIKRHRH